MIGEHPEELIALCDDHLAYAGNNYLPFLPKFYRSHRAVLFRFLAVVPFIPALRMSRWHRRSIYPSPSRSAKKLGYR